MRSPAIPIDEIDINDFSSPEGIEKEMKIRSRLPPVLRARRAAIFRSVHEANAAVRVPKPADE